jgi:methionyl-tRNA formyltransferase
MKIVFMGTPDFARPPLTELAASRHDVLAVVTGQDKRAGRGHRLIATPVKNLAEELGIPVFTPKTLKSTSLYEDLAALKPDLFVVVAFRILPEKLFTLPRLGSVNIHGSLLPRYRGAAPINWALINGDARTGLSSFHLKREVDTGDVILQEEIAIDPDDTFDSLYARMAQLAGPFLIRTLDLIESGKAQPLVQDESLVSQAPKLTPEDGFIDFGFPAAHVRNFVRGMSTRPGAYTTFRGQTIKIHACDVSEVDIPPDTRPGSILPDKKRLLVACAGSVIEIRRIVPQGKREMDGASFKNGYRPAPGELFGEPHKEDETTL